MKKLNFKRFLHLYIPIVIILLLAFLVRLSVLIFDDSLRLDEGHTVRSSDVDLLQMLWNAPNDVHPPLYFLSIKAWRIMFGSGEIAMRSFSLLCMLLAIVFFYQLVLHLYSRHLANWAALIAALSPLWIWYSTEARMYGLLLMLSTLNTLLFFRFVRRPTLLRAFLYAMTIVFLLFSHYLAVLLIISHLVYVFLTWKRHHHLIWSLGFAYCITGICFIPWGAFILANRNVDTTPNLTTPDFNAFLSLCSQMFFGYITESAFYIPIQPVFEILLVAGMVIAMMLLLIFWKSHQIRAETIWLLFCPIIVLGGLFIVSQFRSVFEIRYFLVLTPYIYIVLALSFQQLSRKINPLYIGAAWIMLALLSTYVQTTDNLNSQRVDYRGAAHYIETHAGPDDKVIMDAVFTEPAFDYYYGDHQIFALSYAPTYIEIQHEGEGLIADRVDSVSQKRVIWLVQSYYDRPVDPTQAYLDAHYNRISYTKLSPELQVIGYWGNRLQAQNGK